MREREDEAIETRDVFRHLLERILLDQRQRRVRTVAHGFVEVADILHRQTAPPGAAAVEVRMVPCRHEPLEILEAGRQQPGFHIHASASWTVARSEEHTSELQSLMRISYAVFCLKKKNTKQNNNYAHI